MKRFNPMKSTAISMLILCALTVVFYACSNEEYEMPSHGLKTRATRSTGDSPENLTPDGNWAIEGEKLQLWDVELMPGCNLELRYSWDDADITPNNECEINIESALIYSDVHGDLVNKDHEIVARNVMKVEGQVKNKYMGWSAIWYNGGEIFISCDYELTCLIEVGDSCFKDSIAHDSICNGKLIRTEFFDFYDFYDKKTVTATMFQKNS